MCSRGERRAMLVLADAKGNSSPALARHVTRTSEQVTVLVPKRFSAGQRGSAGIFLCEGQNGSSSEQAAVPVPSDAALKARENSSSPGASCTE